MPVIVKRGRLYDLRSETTGKVVGTFPTLKEAQKELESGRADIRRKGDVYELVSIRSGRVLGRHRTLEAAKRQRRAIAIAKARHYGHKIPRQPGYVKPTVSRKRSIAAKKGARTRARRRAAGAYETGRPISVAMPMVVKKGRKYVVYVGQTPVAEYTSLRGAHLHVKRLMRPSRAR